MNPELPDDETLRERTEGLPTEHKVIVDRLVEDLRAQDGSRSGMKRVLQKFSDLLTLPKGYPTVVAGFDKPGLSHRQAKANRRAWMQSHHETIEANLLAGAVPTFENDQRTRVAIPVSPNIVTRRFAHNLLREVLAPSAAVPMIGEHSTDGESQYKFMAINAMGVGTDSAAATTADTQLGAGASPADQFCWYHITTTGVTDTDDASFGDSLPSAGIDDDLTLDTALGVEVSATDGSSFFSGLRAAANVGAQLSYFDGTGGGEPTDDDFAFQYEFTWPFGSDGEERDGNFGSDASPDSWREIGLANNLHGAAGHNVVPGGAHPDLVHHLATRKVFAGNGFAKTSSVELTNRYKIRFSAG